MALTLPYPDMDFVPLDILTAAEQDQLVANIEYIANQFPLGNANIGSNAVTSNNIDWSTITSEQFIGRFTTPASFTLPTGYRMYRLRGVVQYSGSSSNSAMWITRTNRTGTDWCRRINASASGLNWFEGSYTDGHFMLLGTSDALQINGGTVSIDFTIIVNGNQWVTMGNFTHTGSQDSGISFSQTNTSNSSLATTLQFVSSGRTFQTMDITVTGILA